MITTAEMLALEKKAVEKGVSIAELMEHAGFQVAEFIKTKYDLQGKQIILFAGPGNNGGDGFVAAHYLAEECPVVILFFGTKEGLGEEALKNYERVEKTVPIIQVESPEDLQQFKFQDLEYILVDAMLGTGAKGTIREPVTYGISRFNSLKGIKVAVDLPTGVDADTGETAPEFCQVDDIVTFHDIKQGLEKYKEQVVVVDIGIPA